MGEALLKAVEIDAGERIARRDGATCTRIAALEGYFANSEANNAPFIFAEELVFPEGGDAIKLESRAETHPDALKRKAGKPSGDGLEGSGGDDGGAVGDGVVRKTIERRANDDLLLKEDAEPFGGFFVFTGKREGAGRDFASIGGDREGDEGKIRGIICADEMDDGSTLTVDPFAVNGVECPSTIEGEATGGGDGGFADRNRIERFNGVKADVD